MGITASISTQFLRTSRRGGAPNPNFSVRSKAARNADEYGETAPRSTRSPASAKDCGSRGFQNDHQDIGVL